MQCTEWGVPGWDMGTGGKEEAQKCLLVMMCCMWVHRSVEV